MNEECKIKASIKDDSDKIKANNSVEPSATESTKGLIRIATEEEALEGVNAKTAITPKTLKTVNSTNNNTINSRIDLLEQSENLEMIDIVSLLELRTENMVDLNTL